MKNLKALKLMAVPALIAGSAFMAATPAVAQDAPSGFIACDRAYSPELEELSRIMGDDAYQIGSLAQAAYENNHRITLDFAFLQEFAPWGDRAGQLAYEYYTGHCNYIR